MENEGKRRRQGGREKREEKTVREREREIEGGEEERKREGTLKAAVPHRELRGMETRIIRIQITDARVLRSHCYLFCLF